jgi:mannose-1-phosphate guanylyltransferase
MANYKRTEFNNEGRGREHIALLLAGGDGNRLRELTKEIAGTPIPKQYCRLYGNTSLLEATLTRARLFTSVENIKIIINMDYLDLAMEQAHDLPTENMFVQPENRDTGPGLIFSLLRIRQTCRDATLAVFPTDHFIDNDKAFIAHILRAARIIECMPDKIAIIGIKPDRPETEYGYLVPGKSVRAHNKTYFVKSFCEKPSLSKAKEVLTLGGLWNTFVMVFKLSSMLHTLRQIVPDRFDAMVDLIRTPNETVRKYRTLQPWNFSTDVLTKIPEEIVILEMSDVYWSDWGTRESIERTYREMNCLASWNNLLHQPVHSPGRSSQPSQSSQSIA